MDQDATWYGGRPRPRRHCVDGDTAPNGKGTTSTTFRPISIVAKLLDGSRWLAYIRDERIPSKAVGPTECITLKSIKTALLAHILA